MDAGRRGAAISASSRQSKDLRYSPGILVRYMQMDICDMHQIPDAFIRLLFCHQHPCTPKMTRKESMKSIGCCVPAAVSLGKANAVNGGPHRSRISTSIIPRKNIKSTALGTFQIYGDVDLIKLIGGKFLAKTFHGFDSDNHQHRFHWLLYQRLVNASSRSCRRSVRARLKVKQQLSIVDSAEILPVFQKGSRNKKLEPSAG